MKEKRPLNPAEAYRRAQKRKVKKQKTDARKDRVARIPIDRRDPYHLVSEIQKYHVLEHEGKLTGDGRSHKKRLIDQFYSLRKARINAGLEVMELPKFDPKEYEAKKAKAKQAGGYNAIIERILEDVKNSRSEEDAFDPETGLPNLPEGEPPNPDGVPGLPPYNLIENEGEDLEEQQEHSDFLNDHDEPEGPEEFLTIKAAELKSEEGAKIVYGAPVFHHKVKKDKIDTKVEEFLKGI